MSVGRAERPLIVPVFIPFQGCPHRCVFCDQEKITSQSNQLVDPLFVKKILDTALESSGFNSFSVREVGFYGGTFTSLPVGMIKELLNSVGPYLKKDIFHSVRISTRPDEIDIERLELIKGLGVSTVELGVQSMNDHVLNLSNRGHSVIDIVEAVKLLKHYGFKVGIQLMPGLPGDTEDRFRQSIKEVLELQPDMVRLYPAIVISGTGLARLYADGKYQPLSLDAAVRMCRESCISLENKGIPVIRLGLMSSPDLLEEGQIVAGPWHKAFGFLVRSSIHHEAIEPCLPPKGNAVRLGIRAPEREIPLIRGYKNDGIRLLEEKTGAVIDYVKPDNSIAQGMIEVEEV